MTTAYAEPTLPEDFEPWQHPSPVLDALGSLASHRTDPLRSGFRVTPTKLNGRGFLHGGVVAVLADVCIGHTLGRLATAGQRYLTVNLTCELLGTAHLDDWVDVVIDPSKLGRRLGAGSATFTNGDRTIATAHALFVPAG